ncbi:MAG: hypothetical protein KAS32_01400 [Candidatus Peribacteraceae bacterium]|nr:hypothetical protein [Candidatus Peribacteraceae bacterium]
MAFVLRHPAQEIQFFKFAASPTEDRPIPAGRLVRITGDREVDTIASASDAAQFPIGWLLQKVKDPYTDFPAGFMLRGDLGSSDAFVGDPVGVACGPGAVYETDQYVDEASDGITAGTLLYPDDDGKLSDSNADSAAAAAAVAMNSLTATQTAAGKMLLIKALV